MPDNNIIELGSFIIPAQVFSGRRQIREMESLQMIPRLCDTCGRPLTFREFIATAKHNGTMYRFSAEMLKEIWENDIFILKCCHCYNKIEDEDALDAVIHARLIPREPLVWFYEQEYEQD